MAKAFFVHLHALVLLALGQEHSMNAGLHPAVCNGNVLQELVNVFILPHSERDKPRRDASSLVLPSGVSGDLQDLSGQVFQDRREVHRRSPANARSVLSFAQKPVHAADWELQAGTSRPRFAFGPTAGCTLSLSRHVCANSAC